MTARREPVGLLLAPGAGADRDQATLVALDRALTAEGVDVARMDFAHRKAGRRSPDRPAVLVAAVLAEAAALSASAGVAPDDVFVGGRSMGGRMCSMAVAEGLAARGVVLISYPLHPPGRPDRLRSEHFGALEVPCLFVSGTRDAFASPSELLDASSAIPGPVTHHWVEGKDHGLRGADAEVTAVVLSWVMRWRRQG